MVNVPTPLPSEGDTSWTDWATDIDTGVRGAATTSHTHVATTDLTATGTKSATTFLRGDNTWATPASGSEDLSSLGIYYVNPAAGNDTNTGGSWTSAKATVSSAVAAATAASAKGTIYLAPGTHNVSATLVIPQGVRLIGIGNAFSTQGARLQWTGANDGSYMIRTAGDVSTNDFTGGLLDNFELFASPTGNAGGAYTNLNGIYARNLQNNAHLRNLWIRNLPGDGLYSDSVNGAVPATGFPGYATFERVWITGCKVNWHIRSGFTSLLFNMCAGDIGPTTTDVFVIDPMNTDTFGGRNANYVFIGFKSEDNGGGADANLFTVNTDVSMSFLGCSAKRGSTGTKPWVKYTVAPASLNRVPGTLPVTFTNCHTTNIPSALVDSTSTALLKGAKVDAGESFQIPHFPSEALFPTVRAVKADDRFVRADSTTVLGTTEMGAKTWTQDLGTWGVIGNQAYTSASLANAQATVDAGVADCTVEVTLGATASAAQLILRKTDANNYLYWSGGGSFFKVVAGAQTNLGAPGAFAAGDVLKAVMKGTTVWLYKNGQLVRPTPLVITEQATATKHGLGSNASTAVRFDRFSVTV